MMLASNEFKLASTYTTAQLSRRASFAVCKVSTSGVGPALLSGA